MINTQNYRALVSFGARSGDYVAGQEYMLSAKKAADMAAYFEIVNTQIPSPTDAKTSTNTRRDQSRAKD